MKENQQRHVLLHSGYGGLDGEESRETRFTPHNAQLLTRSHLISISKVACFGRECDQIVCSCLQASTKDKNDAANTSSNDIVVTQNNTHHISNSQKRAEKAMISALKIHFLR